MRKSYYIYRKPLRFGNVKASFHAALSLKVFLGEYIDESTVEDLQMAWKSIGQRMGFVSAGDARRAAEKAGVEKGFDKALDVMRKLGIPEKKIQEAKAMQEKASNK